MPFRIKRKDYSIKLVVTFILLILIIILLFACEKLEFEREVKLDTGTISEATSNSALINGEILDIGENEIIQHGHCWSNAINPTIALETKTQLGIRKGRGSFISALSDLLPNTKYYVRAYVTNSQGTTYGSQLSFTTRPALPTVTTTIVSAITSTSAQSGGNVTSDGGASVTARGVCWSTSQNPTVENSKTTNGTGIGSFTSSLTGLSTNTTYYVMAFATNSLGTGYGNQVSFTTNQNITLPTVTTTSVTSITSATAQSGGNVTSDGGVLVTARGVCWGTSPNPTMANSKTTNGSGTGLFTSNLTGLSPTTSYYVRAYATNSQGTAYGSQVSFTTADISLPTITTTSINSILATSAQGGGNVTSDGGASVTARGVCWSTSQNPTIADNKVTSGSGTGQFTGNMVGLSPNTTYYVRAYATNAQGTGYGNQVSFTTLSSSSGTFIDNRDGNMYNWVQIGNQIWMSENLAYLPSVSPPSNGSATEPYYNVYGYNGTTVSEAKGTVNYTKYGTLYNWPAAMNGAASSNTNPSGVQGVCPSGWHLPSDAEWSELTGYLGGEGVAGGKLKEVSYDHWASPNTGADNSSGFTALPGGYRNNLGEYYDIGLSGNWWLATKNVAEAAEKRTLGYNYESVFKGSPWYVGSGFSVRCVRD